MRNKCLVLLAGLLAGVLAALGLLLLDELVGFVRLGDRLRPIALVAGFAAALLTFLVLEWERRHVSELRAAAAERLSAIEINKQKDSLSGVLSRFAFMAQLEARLRRLGSEEHVAVMLLDLDRFKWVNDTFGHHAGDQILAHVGRVLTREVRDGLVGRLGGDEFAVALDRRFATPEQAHVEADRIRIALAEAAPVLGRRMRTEATVGVALAPGHGASAEELLQHADIALYAAKKTGRRGVRMFTQAMLDHQRHKKLIEAELFNALSSGGLELHYQPLIRLSDGAVYGFESLLRWRHPTLGLIPPSEFISIAEGSSLIEHVGDWVINTACRDAHLLPDVRVAINVSPAQLRLPDFAERLLIRLSASGIEADRLAIEITENVLLDANEQQVKQLEKLRKAGVFISLDDFGSGYSGLNYLRELPITSLKIDKSFVQNLHSSHADRVFVSAIAQFGKGLGITVIAEGVETAEHEVLVRAAGCEVAQGYLYAKAMPLREAYAFARRRLMRRITPTPENELASVRS